MMSPHRLAASLFVALVLFTTSAFAQTTLTSDPPDTFTLQNGLQVLVIQDHRTPVVTQMVWYKVGSADETPGQIGARPFPRTSDVQGHRQASGRRILQDRAEGRRQRECLYLGR